MYTRLFLEAWNQPLCSPLGFVITPRRYKDPDLPKSSAYTLKPGIPTPGWSILLRPPLYKFYTSGTGILTRFPSATLFSLALGAD